jgi:hypothetical protein
MKARESYALARSRVLFKLKRTHKSMPEWVPNPYNVVGVNGSMVTTSRPGHTIAKNSSFFKLYFCSFEDDKASSQGEVRGRV